MRCFPWPLECLAPGKGRCSRVIQPLLHRAHEKDAAKHLAVAAAHGEFGVEAEEGVLNSFLGKVVDRFKGGAAPENDFMNISPSEQAALDRLKKAMPLPRD